MTGGGRNPEGLRRVLQKGGSSSRRWARIHSLQQPSTYWTTGISEPRNEVVCRNSPSSPRYVLRTVAENTVTTCVPTVISRGQMLPSIFTPSATATAIDFTGRLGAAPFTL